MDLAIEASEMRVVYCTRLLPNNLTDHFLLLGGIPHVIVPSLLGDTASTCWYTRGSTIVRNEGRVVCRVLIVLQAAIETDN